MQRRRRILAALGLVLLAALLVPGTGFGVLWRVYGPSMEPTISDGSLVVVDPLGPRSGGYQRGDIVIIEDPGRQGGYPFATIIKRVIAVPGEHVRAADGVVHVEGEVLDEPYLSAATGSGARFEVDTVVPDGQVFVLGDHRSASLDSSAFGPVPIERLHGRVVLIVGSGGIDQPVPSPQAGVAAAAR